MFLDTAIAVGRICPQCQTGKLKIWNELSDDEKSFTRYFPESAEFSREERERHLFCMRCRYESFGEMEVEA